jgi:hypothetical protein
MHDDGLPMETADCSQGDQMFFGETIALGPQKVAQNVALPKFCKN